MCFRDKFKKAAKNGGKTFSGENHQMTNFAEITLFHTVFKKKMFLHFMQKFKMAAKNSGKNDFWEKLPVDFGDTLRGQNFAEIDLSRTVSEINSFLRLHQKFKMAGK